IQKDDSSQYFSRREVMTDVLAVYLNLRRIVRFIFSESNVGFSRREYPSITLDFSNFFNLWRTVLSVIVYPKFWRYFVISYDDLREFFPSWTNRILSISSTTKKYGVFCYYYVLPNIAN